jgi:beta-mannanase
VALFLKGLKDKNGKEIPFIFRPWHEMDGGWFWWGSQQCTQEEFRRLFSYTVHYLKVEKGLDQMLIAYSPDRNFDTEKEYLGWYPGDEYVDILGVDNYADLKRKDGAEEAIKKLHIVIGLAQQKSKLCAFTETGSENVSDEKWYSQRLGKVLSDPLIAKEISYVMVWRNDDKVHYFFPYPGHQEAADAKELLLGPNILLLNDYNTLK